MFFYRNFIVLFFYIFNASHLTLVHGYKLIHKLTIHKSETFCCVIRFKRFDLVEKVRWALKVNFLTLLRKHQMKLDCEFVVHVSLFLCRLIVTHNLFILTTVLCLLFPPFLLGSHPTSLHLMINESFMCFFFLPFCCCFVFILTFSFSVFWVAKTFLISSCSLI